MHRLGRVVGRPDFPKLETEILAFWKNQNILQQSINQRQNQPLKALYDGPITANGQPHHGHMLTFAIKDLFPRYWTMKGYYAPRSLGWDCQGIPVEYEVEKKLGFTQKKDIEAYGIAEFNQLCRESVLTYRQAMIHLEERIGRLTTEEEEYATMDANYIESIWWSLSRLHQQGLLYEGFKVVPYSTRAGTILSNAEVSLGGYKKQVDPAVSLKFALTDYDHTYLLAWTTTPWTLPTNFALAVGKGIQYIEVTTVKDPDTRLILAQERAEDILGAGMYTIQKTWSAEELIGLSYRPIFPFFPDKQNAYRIYEGFQVTTDTGTGIVHLAPYGAEDCEIFAQVGITPTDVLDAQGDFTEVVSWYQGMHYKQANLHILEYLQDQNLVWEIKDYEHDLPMCWRTDTPLIYKPVTSWYIAVSNLRDKLVEHNSQINWVPKHVQQGRFGNWLKEIKDWSISRMRYWGTPLPIWKSESGKVKVIGSFAELQSLTGRQLEDPHRPFVDDFSFEIDGETYNRIPDVLDVWYDSGAMPFARLHYPFENQDLFQQRFPGEFISEGVDQTRGWFYTLHAISTALFDSPAFQNVIMSGFALDDKGVKLSKSKKNYASPLQILDQFGADAIRLNFFSTPITAGEDTIISEKTLKITTQEWLLPLWNLYVYVCTYADLHNWEVEADLWQDPQAAWQKSLSHPLDIWMIARIKQTTDKTRLELDNYQVQKALEAIKEYMEDFSKWYIRRNRERFVAGDIQVLRVSYFSLLQLVRLLAPFAPFISEYIYGKIVSGVFEQAPISVHLNDYPELTGNREEDELIQEMAYIRNICSIGQKLRTQAGIKLRQPLENIYIQTQKPISRNLLDIVGQELNLNQVHTPTGIPTDADLLVATEAGNLVALDIRITPELKLMGQTAELLRQLQSWRRQQGLQMGELAWVDVAVLDTDLKQIFQTQTDTLAEKTALQIRCLPEAQADMDQILIDQVVLYIRKSTQTN